MKKQFIRGACSLLMLFVVMGCSLCKTSQNDELKSISSSPLLKEDWGRHEFKKVGFSCNVPEKIFYAAERTYDVHSASFHLCPIKPPKGIIADTRFRIIVSIKKVQEKALAKDKKRFLESGLYQRSDELGKKLGLWMHELHKRTDSFTKGGYTYYRRDIVLENDEIFSADVEVLHVYGQNDKDKKADDILVRRILDSIEPL